MGDIDQHHGVAAAPQADVALGCDKVGEPQRSGHDAQRLLTSKAAHTRSPLGLAPL